jgi:hypothetical protein
MQRLKYVKFIGSWLNAILAFELFSVVAIDVM